MMTHKRNWRIQLHQYFLHFWNHLPHGSQNDVAQPCNPAPGSSCFKDHHAYTLSVLSSTSCTQVQCHTGFQQCAQEQLKQQPSPQHHLSFTTAAHFHSHIWSFLPPKILPSWASIPSNHTHNLLIWLILLCPIRLFGQTNPCSQVFMGELQKRNNSDFSHSISYFFSMHGPSPSSLTHTCAALSRNELTMAVCPKGDELNG